MFIILISVACYLAHLLDIIFRLLYFSALEFPFIFIFLYIFDVSMISYLFVKYKIFSFMSVSIVIIAVLQPLFANFNIWGILTSVYIDCPWTVFSFIPLCLVILDFIQDSINNHCSYSGFCSILPKSLACLF